MTRRIQILSLVLITALLLPALASAEATTWKVDPVHSNVQFSVRHFLTPVTGRFTEFSGTIVYDPEKVASSSVEFTVQAASVDTKNERRDGHLKSPDFFDVEKFSTLSFKSQSVEGGDGNLQVTGELTIHGVTKTVTVPVQALGAMDTPMGRRAGFVVDFTIDRKDFGMVWNRTLDQGGAILGDEVKISIAVEATLPQSST